MEDHQVHKPVSPGEPGYRTQAGRSGLDPVDTQLEVARMEGTFLSKLIRLQLRTRNPVYIMGWLVVVTILLVPTTLAIIEAIGLLRSGQPVDHPVLVAVLPVFLLSLLLVVNFCINVVSMVSMHRRRIRKDRS